MQALIQGWRNVWQQGDFPFYYVQLATFGFHESLAAFWEAQTAALSIPNTGMAVANDIGELKNIHPRNKQDVGKRLALWALAKDYGRTDLVYMGPMYKSMSVEDGKIRVHFEHTGSGLTRRDGKPLTCFQVAGADRAFVTAHAEIGLDGETVLVGNDTVPAPVAVRYLWVWEDEPTLVNEEGLPANAFRSDDWE
jgi:sialate O-acetylesterase